MALKKQFDMSATFSMASMTDVIFLLLIFFMVTSTFVFPNALQVNLPESSSQTTLKPTARIYLTAEGEIRFISITDDGQAMQNDVADPAELLALLQAEKLLRADVAGDDGQPLVVGLYADKEVPYGSIVEILNLGVQSEVRIVLATSAPEANPEPLADEG